jgi:hypothetical protein
MLQSRAWQAMSYNEGPIDSWLTAPEAPSGEPDEVHRLFVQLEYQTWPERARELDRFFWTQANSRLGHEEITSVINRQALGVAEARAVAGYVQHAKSVLTNVLTELDERAIVEAPSQGLTWLLCERPREHEPARIWLRTTDPRVVRDQLSTLPGFAFLILAAVQDDAVESFLARDAFWDAILGQAREGSTGHEGYSA